MQTYANLQLKYLGGLFQLTQNDIVPRAARDNWSHYRMSVADNDFMSEVGNKCTLGDFTPVMAFLSQRMIRESEPHEQCSRGEKIANHINNPIIIGYMLQYLDSKFVGFFVIGFKLF